MQKQKNIIIWQKWVDPFGEDCEIEQNIETNDPNFIDDEIDDNNDILSDTIETNYEKTKLTKVIATPMGIIPIDENTASGKIFNFWVGHTNFSITQFIALLIEKTPGVECLDIFTRYRFRIAIGKAFNGSEVMTKIQDEIYSHLSD